MAQKSIGIIAGETSGDILGAALINVLKKQLPDVYVEGIAGPRMRQAGCHALWDISDLSVMGFTDVLKKIPHVLHVRRHIIQHWLTHKPDIVIGIDYPDFNLSVEKKLHAAGIKVVHYVSPSVWAWRSNRIHTIKKAVDGMLALFPFEVPYYERAHIPVYYVGHPLADALPSVPCPQIARKVLNLDPNTHWIALLPGSRAQELTMLVPLFLETARWIAKRRPDIRFVTGMVNAERAAQFRALLSEADADTPAIEVRVGQTHDVMAACDAMLIASGTATLEAMFIGRPMVVAYRVSFLNYWLARCLVRTPYIALPNILAQSLLVPEYIQSAATPDVLGADLLRWLDDVTARTILLERFDSMRTVLHKNAAESAATAIMEILHA